MKKWIWILVVSFVMHLILPFFSTVRTRETNQQKDQLQTDKLKIELSVIGSRIANKYLRFDYFSNLILTKYGWQ